MRWRILAVAVELAALACFVVAYLNRDIDVQRDVVVTGSNVGAEDPGTPGWTAYAPLEEADPTPSRFEPFDFWDGYLWLGAGTALAIVGAAMTLMVVRDLLRYDSLEPPEVDGPNRRVSSSEPAARHSGADVAHARMQDHPAVRG